MAKNDGKINAMNAMIEKLMHRDRICYNRGI